MGLLELIAGAGIVALLIHKEKEERKRKSIPCDFTEGISKEEFESIARQSGKRIKRLSALTIDGTVVRGTVQSQSGISEWTFTVDFNDYGKISGKYWISTTNSDSDIPKKVAENIKDGILNCQKRKKEE